MKIDRREFTTQLAALGLAGWFRPLYAFGAAAAPLQRLAASKGLLFGSCLALKYFVQSPAYQQLFVEQCDIATPELHMKWSSLSPRPGVYDFQTADNFVAFCAAQPHQGTRPHPGLA